MTDRNKNLLFIVNTDADQVALKIAVNGELNLSTAEIRTLLSQLRDCVIARNIIVDFGRGHSASASEIRFGALDARITHEELITRRNAALVDLSPDLNTRGAPCAHAGILQTTTAPEGL